MNKAIPAGLIPPYCPPFLSIRKDEREKTIKEVLEFLKEDPYCDCIAIRSFEKKFLIPSSVDAGRGVNSI